MFVQTVTSPDGSDWLVTRPRAGGERRQRVTASLVVGVAAANSTSSDILVAGVAGWWLARCRWRPGICLSEFPVGYRKCRLGSRAEGTGDRDESEWNELAAIYASRGVEPSLARQVADQLMAHDALAAHARDELGISDLTTARPVQAAFASAGTFAIGAAMPLVTALVTPRTALIPVVIATSILFLALLGGFGAHAGGAPIMKAAFRVTFWERWRWHSRRGRSAVWRFCLVT